MEELKNATFNGLDRGMISVTLTDGAWRGDTSGRKGLSTPRVALEDDFILQADIDSNGVMEAVVILTETFGGPETYVYMAAVSKDNDSLVNPGTEMLGDRIQVRNIRMNGGILQLDFIEQAPHDQVCCPGQLVTKNWELTPKGFVLQSLRSPGRLTPDVVSESEWALERWNIGQPVEKGAGVTLTYQEGRFVGSSGCNRYFASVTTGQIPGAIAVGPVGGTRMTCPDSAMAIESRFQRELAGVMNFGFHNTYLALTTLRDSSTSTMLFRRKGS